ncbi:Tetratricopeptide repeat-containing protein [Alkalispirochaeta americana]|uniref:Tetratricopeptide repeat-containing protein n=1 Tax=Alkalispirochaeta americana TaxID=159291 RepID=A0A1N6RJT8_9SPIO|nr:tetratricopeptide repeat protein [Alkalispirochaeta americana]SIQ29091.1 Tetratricopeptide repeat-containing protein [Alkalispirochaeta americana]
MKRLFSRLRTKYLERTGLNAYALGRHAEAERSFLALLALDGDRPGVRHNLGLAFLAQEKFSQAEELFLHELSRLGDHFPRLRVLGDLYYQWGKPHQAAEMYQRSLDEDCPRQDRAFLEMRCEICRDPERFHQARLSRESYLRGNRAMEEGDIPGARQALDEALRLDPSNVPAWNNLGTLLLNHCQDPAGAAEAFREGLRLQPVPWLQANLEKALGTSDPPGRSKARTSKGTAE